MSSTGLVGGGWSHPQKPKRFSNSRGALLQGPALEQQDNGKRKASLPTYAELQRFNGASLLGIRMGGLGRGYG